MRKKIVLIFVMTILATVCLVVFGSAANDSQITDNVYFMANSENESTCVYSQSVNGEQYLFLPSSANLSLLTLYYPENELKSLTAVPTAGSPVSITSGTPFDFTSLFSSMPSNNEYSVVLQGVSADDTVCDTTITVMKSASVRSMYLVSDDPINEGRAWVDTSKSNVANGHVALIDKNGSVDYSNKLSEIKARGNSTFTDFVKKAYQIKLDKKADLIGNDKNEANKKWILLANAADITLIHNIITFDIAKMIKLPFTPNSESIDLYYDGEYRGSYLLTEKTEVDETRIDIANLDDLIEDANKKNPAYDEPTVVTKTIASKGETSAKADTKGTYKYVDGLTEPELTEGTSHHAYLLELDFLTRYPDEQSGFVTNRGQAVVTKNPEYLTKDTGAFISQFWQDFEDAVYSENGYNTATGKYYYEYCDLDSLAKIYLINELSKNYDSFRSSTFFYLSEDEDIMHAGPVWDFDIGYGTGYNGNRQVAASPSRFFSVVKSDYMLMQLMKIQSFRDKVQDLLNPTDGEFYQAVKSLLTSDGSVAVNSSNVYASQMMNYKLWDINDKVIGALFCDDEATYSNSISFLKWYLSNRIDWLADTTSKWSGSSYSLSLDNLTYFNKTYRYHREVNYYPSVAATCAATGLTEGQTCKICNEVLRKQSATSKAAHKFVTDAAVAPTCAQTGLTEGKHCKVCGEVTIPQEVIPTLEHSYGEFIVTKPATCAESGTQTSTCTVCGTFIAMSIPKVPHTVETDAAVAPTCTTSGLTEGSHCSVCSKILTEQETVPATGHTPGEYVTIKEATQTETGLEQQKCTVCGEVLDTRIIPAEGHVHSFGEWTVSIPATCAGDGLEIRICPDCGIVEKRAIPALAHTYIYDAEDARNSIICKVYKCSVCNEVKLVAVNAYYLLGDMNLDGVVTAYDARIALRVSANLVKFTANYMVLGDINGDGNITATDARSILRISAGLERAPSREPSSEEASSEA